MGYFQTSDSTLVGTISLSADEENQFSAVITKGVYDWRVDADFTIQYQGFQYMINLDMFDVLIDETIQSIVPGDNNLVLFELSESNQTTLLNELSLVFSTDLISDLNYDALFNDVIFDMGSMNILKHYRLEQYLYPQLEETVIDSVIINSLTTNDVDSITGVVTSLMINADSRFSLLSTLSAFSLTNTQLSIVASEIQYVTRNTPFSGFIFSQNYPLPDWADEGMNVKILQTNNYDFTFYNDIDLNYTIEISRVSDSAINIALIGYPFAADYETDQTEEMIIPFEIEYYDNPALNAATPDIIIIDNTEETIYRLLIEAGQDGQIVCFTRTITLPDSTEYTEIIYREIYFPTTQIYQENIVEK